MALYSEMWKILKNTKNYMIAWPVEKNSAHSEKPWDTCLIIC